MLLNAQNIHVHTFNSFRSIYTLRSACKIIIHAGTLDKRNGKSVKKKEIVKFPEHLAKSVRVCADI